MRQEQRGPLSNDPEEAMSGSESQASMPQVLYAQDMADNLGIDLQADDWTFTMLTSNGKPKPPAGLDLETDSTITTFYSKSQKTIMVTFSDSVNNDIDVPGTQKLPNSELIYQIVGKDDFPSLKYIWRHPIANKGTVQMIQQAYQTKNFALGEITTWTTADGDVWYIFLGTRNGRPAVFISTDHPSVMRCLGVIMIHTQGQISSATTGTASMVEELGQLPNC
jgi:hypothetical protein